MQQISKHVLGDQQRLYDYLRALEGEVSGLQRLIVETNRVRTIASLQPPDTSAIRDDLELQGRFPLNVTGLLGRLAEAQFADIPQVVTHPDPLVVTYNLYILIGPPETFWGINRNVNPPVKFQITVTTTTFLDSSFLVTDDVDTTKKLVFDVGTLVAAATTRTMKVPDADQVLAGRDVDNAFSAFQTLAGGIGLNNVSVTSSPVTLTSAQTVALVSTAAARTVKFPAAPITDELHVVKDATGNAAANNITVSGNGKNIDSLPTHTINVNLGSFVYHYDGTQWFIIAKF